MINSYKKTCLTNKHDNEQNTKISNIWMYVLVHVGFDFGSRNAMFIIIVGISATPPVKSDLISNISNFMMNTNTYDTNIMNDMNLLFRKEEGEA